MPAVSGILSPMSGTAPEHRPRIRYREPLLNAIYIRRGRTVEPCRDDEVVVSEAFADAHNYRPGDRLRATIRGKRRILRIVGVALSPEFDGP